MFFVGVEVERDEREAQCVALVCSELPPAASVLDAAGVVVA